MATLSPQVPAAPAMGGEELARYARQLTLPGIGLGGQATLKAASVLVIGAGGLGSPTALYLAAAGVGRLGIADPDAVELSNLHRQVLHTTARIGQPKVESAREALAALNPHVQVEPHHLAVDATNAEALVAAYDLVIDGSDNFPTRYAVSDACVLQGRPYVYGSVQRFDGQVSLFGAPDGPCYRCLFRDPPPTGAIPSCAEAGVFGVMPGLVGMLQAAEAIKWIVGAGEPLVGRLLLIDALRMQFRTIAVRRDPACPSCGTRTITAPVAYDDVACDVPTPARPMLVESDPETVRALLASKGDAVFLLDVREPHEWAIAHIAGASLVPLRTIPARVQDIPRDRTVVVYCHHGMRSRMAGEYLVDQGYGDVVNLAGGIDAWSATVDPSLPRY
jgi:adenylyltransferase/sulfurtransferase